MRSKCDFPKLTSSALLSPMAGVTDVAFRTLAKQYGAGLTYTEFVSSAAVVRGKIDSLRMIKTDPSEQPVAIQLFGNSIKEVVAAAQAVEDRFDIIDINCGCPAWKVIKTGAGSAMLKEPHRIADIVNKIANAVQRPVTVKIRKGIDERHVNAVEIARLVQDAGAAAVAVHGRTQKQGYSGNADWDIIKDVKAAIDIPVIGNGDVTSPELFKRRMDESGADLIMIARAAISNPYIFSQIADYTTDGSYGVKTQLEQCSDYLHCVAKYRIPFASVKRHIIAFTKGMDSGAKLRQKMSFAKSMDEINALLQ